MYRLQCTVTLLPSVHGVGSHELNTASPRSRGQRPSHDVILQMYCRKSRVNKNKNEGVYLQSDQDSPLFPIEHFTENRYELFLLSLLFSYRE